ncbi:hypothetical protein WJX74_005654 [Apatococcus lobatus]|uniref:Uncharacterized protein n=1 Tax=Apatococcus lobatus TaxID=904363 RepID=A0AAW1Q829_9CHLO
MDRAPASPEPTPLPSPPRIKVNKHLDSVKDQDDTNYAVSPSTPLLSTAIEENGWVSGQNSNGQLGVGGTADVLEPQVLQVVRRWAALSLGQSHSAGVGGEGEAFTWGSNTRGQLGCSAGEPRDVPTKMDILRGWDVQAISCGGEHTIALTQEDVISWGANSEGQCGQGERAEQSYVKPRSIKPLQGMHVSQVVCGVAHTLCVTATSQVYAWGSNAQGQLGTGHAECRRAPTFIDGLWAMPVHQLAAGDYHSAALTQNGFLFTWGSNDKGQLGLPAAAELATQTQRTGSARRRQRRSVNQRFLLAMTDMGIPADKAELALYETGNVGVEVATEWLFSVPQDVLDKHVSSDPNTPTHDEDKHQEKPAEEKRVTAPRRVPLQGVRWVAAGGQHTVAVAEKQVFSWGSNSSGQLGTRTFKDQSSPAEVKSLEGMHVVQAACGTQHTLFLCGDGSVYGCGSTKHGQLPSLRFGNGQPGVEIDDDGMGSPRSDDSQGVEQQQPRNEMTVPTKLRLPFMQPGRPGGSKTPIVCAVIAGSNASAFLTRAQSEFPETSHVPLWTRLQCAIQNVALEQSGAAAFQEGSKGSHPSAKHLKPITQAMELVFGSAAAISAAFGLKDAVGLDVQALDTIQHDILTLYKAPAVQSVGADGMPSHEAIGDSIAGLCSVSIVSALYKATGQLLDDLNRNVRLLSTPERAQVLLAAAQSRLLSEKKFAVVLIPRLCNTILAAPSSARHCLVKWWAEYPGPLLQERVVDPLQQYLTDELFATKKLTVSVMNVIKVLARVEEANQIGRKLPPEAFYNELISEKLDVEDHYVAWRQSHDQPHHSYGADGPFSFCTYPFLLNPRAKSKLLHVEARIAMTKRIHEARMEHMQGGAGRYEERVLPDSKAGASARQREQREAEERAKREERERERRERQRTRQQHGLRHIWNTLVRPGASDSSAASSTTEMPGVPPGTPTSDDGNSNDYVAEQDFRNMAARSVSTGPGSRTSPKASGGGMPVRATTLVRSGSMNLPRPADSGVPAVHPDMCIVRIRRNHLLEDALDEVARQLKQDLFKPLRVHFIGEEGIDAGGVKKEFFQLLITELLSPDYGMLIFQPESRTYWFNPATLEAEDEFMLIGLVLSLAIYNAVLLDFPLPLALYKKLIGQPVALRDLEDMEPTLGRSLRQLLQYEGEGTVEGIFCQNFTAGLPGIGETISVALKEDGDDIMVTEENRREYVDLFVDFYLNRSVNKQFEAFARGFQELLGGPAINLFSGTELERLVCGNPLLDFAALQKHSRYDGGYTPEHRAVRWLWEIVHEFDDEEKRRFLKFFSGSDRAPIGGLGNLRCIIQRDGTDSNKLPTSHTCFNTLLLPSYRSKDKMGDRLRLAIMNSEGFGLE